MIFIRLHSLGATSPNGGTINTQPLIVKLPVFIRLYSLVASSPNSGTTETPSLMVKIQTVIKLHSLGTTSPNWITTNTPSLTVALPEFIRLHSLGVSSATDAPSMVMLPVHGIIFIKVTPFAFKFFYKHLNCQLGSVRFSTSELQPSIHLSKLIGKTPNYCILLGKNIITDDYFAIYSLFIL